MKVIFLDIDGVLNSIDWWNSERNHGNIGGEASDMDPLCIERINRLSKETNSKIVISSSWRHDPFYKRTMNIYGIKNVIGRTPVTSYVGNGADHNFVRGEEIKMFLELHPEIENYVIFDDENDMLDDQQSHFIHTDDEVGLTDEDAEKAKEILNK